MKTSFTINIILDIFIFINLFLLNIQCRQLTDSPTVVINTWGFTDAAREARNSLESGGDAIDAVLDGCSYCEINRCDGSVGYGSHPDEQGQTTLDAMIMDGITHGVGAVANLRDIKEAIRVAFSVMRHSRHTMLTGEQATDFAVEMGFTKTSLQTNSSIETWENWKNNQCQPNFRQNVSPDPTTSCGPYQPIEYDHSAEEYLQLYAQNKVDHDLHMDQSNSHDDDLVYSKDLDMDGDLEGDLAALNVDLNDVVHNHDTIGMVVLDDSGNLAGGTSTNGANHKVPGRVGDSPIPGSGSYVDNDVGGAAATGDGDVMMRFLPSFLIVELMRNGMTPTEASEEAISRIVSKYPDFSGAVIALRKDGEYGAACHNVGSGFPFSVYVTGMEDVELHHVECIHDIH